MTNVSTSRRKTVATLAIALLTGTPLLVASMSGCADSESEGTGFVDAAVDASSIPGDAAANDAATSCASGKTECSGACVTVANDPANCGACGNACDAGDVCSVGKCGLFCAGGSTKCGDRCVDEMNDPANCGACGNSCGAASSCASGSCELTCASDEQRCPGVDAGVGDGGSSAYCANTNRDNANCGSCGHACSAGEVCAGGTCSANCGSTATLCTPDAGTSYCADEMNDNTNCGACGVTCKPGSACSSGSCKIVCGGATQHCAIDAGDSCSDITSDPNNCGGCGNVCPSGQVCSASKCAALCGTGLTNCSNACVDESSSSANCGACGRSCPSSGACTDGTCAPHIYTGSFTTNVTATAACTDWTTFTSGLATSGYVSVSVRGTFDTVGITCNDPTVVDALAAALHSGTPYYATCNGHTWSNCNRYNGELWVDGPSVCSGQNCPSPGYIVRPCIALTSLGSVNWGGVNTLTCGTIPSQTMTVVFQ